MKKEIHTINDIKLLVDTFYAKVREDDLLKNVFNTIIQDRWPQHLEKMYAFWQTLLFHEAAYRGNPLFHHLHLPVEEEHFNQWIHLFTQTVDEHFTGDTALEAKMRANKIAAMFQFKIKQFHGRV